ncbi:MAG TPA: PepSY domain-containing protein [Candidatus Baltobacteraceae bacterium]|nr:PepSY domain-containing protein [Candidatus Baltobacteraceae bacterium]
MKVLALLLALAGLGIAPMAANAAGFTYGPGVYANGAQRGVTRMQAAQIALRAVGGGRVIGAQYENDVRPYWQIEIAQPTTQWEVNVGARSGKVLSVIRQGENS